MSELKTTYTEAQRTRIARTARRSAKSEASVIFSAGGASIAVAFFVLGFPGIFSLASIMGLSVTTTWVVVSFGLSALVALIHFNVARGTIAKAQALDASFLHEHEAQERRKLNAKIAAMKGAEK